MRERFLRRQQTSDTLDLLALFEKPDTAKLVREVAIALTYSNQWPPMRPIRCIEHKGHARQITPFVGKQIDIASAFEFEIPEGCDAKYKSKKSREKKVGRPAKAKVVSEPKG